MTKLELKHSTDPQLLEDDLLKGFQNDSKSHRLTVHLRISLNLTIRRCNQFLL